MGKSEERLKRSQKIKEKAQKLKSSTFAQLWSIVKECSSILNEIAPNKRRLWLVHIIDEIYKHQDGCCALCKEPLDYKDLNVDHIVPFTFGGGNEKGNLQVVHSLCNKQKGTQIDPEELLDYLEDKYMNLNILHKP